MGWSIPPLVVLVIVAGVVSPAISGGLAGIGGSSPPSTSTAGTATPTATGGEMQPGARLAGEIGVRNAELEGDVESRAFEISIDRANSSEAKARIVSERVPEVRQEIAALERRRTQLRRARENGSMSPEEYRARRAMIAARAQTRLDILVRAEQISKGLPALVLEDVAVDLTTIQALQDRARALAEAETTFSG